MVSRVSACTWSFYDKNKFTWFHHRTTSTILVCTGGYVYIQRRRPLSHVLTHDRPWLFVCCIYLLVYWREEHSIGTSLRAHSLLTHIHAHIKNIIWGVQWSSGNYIYEWVLITIQNMHRFKQVQFLPAHWKRENIT